MNNEINDYQSALDFIFGLVDYEKMSHNRAAQNYDPRRIRLLMHELGDPHLQVPCVHVAGTKGKGSTATMIASILEEAYGNVGLFTSPHLVTPRERIVLGRKMISEEDLISTVQDIAPVITRLNNEEEYGRVTTFETLTALAFFYFAKKGASYNVIEVGLGGRLDATNVVLPRVSVISVIGLDHTDVLGDTLAKIAAEKCGIIKDNIPVVSAEQAPESALVVQETAQVKHSSLASVGKDVTYEILDRSYEKEDLHFMIHGMKDDYDIHLPVLGDFQAKNASLAVLAAESLDDERITRQVIEDGLRKMSIIGRFQFIDGPVKILIDGAHNNISADELQRSLVIFKDIVPRILIIGLSDDKDYQGVLHRLVPFFDYVITTRADNPRAKDPEELALAVYEMGYDCETQDSVKKAVERASDLCGSCGFICVTGSLFVAGEAIGFLKQQ